MLKFVLASSSPRRKEILSKLGLNFVVVKHRYKEPKVNNHPKAANFVKQVALNKAKSLKDIYKNYVIISADTIVVLKNNIIGKPKNVNEAKEILKKLSDTKHKVYTSICLFYPKKNLILSSVGISYVYTNKLSLKKIDVLSKKNLDKAGAYAVQHKNDKFVKKIVGDYYNVVGFPVEVFLKLYRDLLIKIIKGEFYEKK